MSLSQINELTKCRCVGVCDNVDPAPQGQMRTFTLDQHSDHQWWWLVDDGVCVHVWDSVRVHDLSHLRTLTIKDLQFIKLLLAVKQLHIDVDDVTCHNKLIWSNIVKTRANYKDIILLRWFVNADLQYILSGCVTTLCQYDCIQYVCLPLPGIMCSSHEQVWLFG